MGKLGREQENVDMRENNEDIGTTLLSLVCCPGFKKELNLKCAAVLILSVAIFLSALFFVLPSSKIKSGFDAKAEIKNSAIVQAYFKIQMPISLLVPQISALQSDITAEIGVPYTKVAILSVHEDGTSNHTDVVFGILPDPVNVPVNPLFLSLLKSTLIELFLQQSNLTFTIPNAGKSSFFEILKFPGGITVIPLQSASVWQIQQTLFNFTLNNSINEIQEHFVEFKEQLKVGLHLRSSENIYVQVTNGEGSTVSCPVTVQASILSDLGSLLPQRLKQLVRTITRSSSAKNLGLNSTVFGRVNGISLSSYLKGSFHAIPPTPSPAPSPELNEYAGPSTSPDFAPSSFVSSPPPCHTCGDHYLHAPPVKRLTPLPCPYEGSVIPPNFAPPPHVDSDSSSSSRPTHNNSPDAPHDVTSKPHLSPNMPPLPTDFHSSGPGEDDEDGK